MTIAVERDRKKSPKKPGAASLAEKKALIDSLCGSLSWVDYSVDEYLREKREEIRRENGK